MDYAIARTETTKRMRFGFHFRSGSPVFGDDDDERRSSGVRTTLENILSQIPEKNENIKHNFPFKKSTFVRGTVWQNKDRIEKEFCWKGKKKIACILLFCFVRSSRVEISVSSVKQMVLILDSLCRALLHRDLYWFVSLNNPYIYQETGRRTNWRKMKIDYFQFPGRVVESERARSLSGRWIYGSTLLSSERWRMWRIYMDFSRSDWMDCIYHEWVNHFGAFKAMS